MARVFTTCPVHVACQVETRDGVEFKHHDAQPQPRSPIAPEGQPAPIPVAPDYWLGFKRWRARQARKWKRRLT